MTRIKLTLCIFGLMISLGQSESIPGGTVVGDTGVVIWTPAGNPYLIQGDITIENLIILPGTNVVITGEYVIQVDGILKAGGTYDSLITFSGIFGLNVWNGIHFTSASSLESELSFCKFIYTQNQAIQLGIDIKPLRNCVITDNDGHGIVIDRSLASIQNCIISNNSGNGIHIPAGSWGILSLENSLISENDMGIYSEDNFDYLDIKNSVVADNDQEGIICSAGSLDITNSIVYYNSSSIVSLPNRTTANYNNIEGAGLFSGMANINEIPGFIDRTSYHLNGTSPCIDKGDSSLTYNDIYFPPSEGSLRNDMGAYGGPLAGKWIKQLTVDSGFIDFGAVSISSPLAVPITLFNDTDSAISVSDIHFTDSDSAYFSVNTASFPVAEHSDLDAGFIFSPDAQRNFSAEATVSSDKGTIRLLLNGQGLAPAIALSDSQIIYDTLAVFEESMQSFTIYNNGQSELIVYQDSVNLSGPDYSDFSFDFPGNDILIAVADSYEINIMFNPATAGQKQAILNFTCNDPENPQKQIELSGYSIKSAISLSDTVLDFGTIEATFDSSQQITIYNEGTADLKIDRDSLLISGINSGFMVELPVEDLIIAQNDSVVLTITFLPADSGYKSARLEIYSNDYERSPFNVSLKGSAYTEPKILITETDFNFGEVALKEGSLRLVKIKNTGTADLLIYKDSLSISGTGASHFSIELPSTDLLIQKSDSAYIAVMFKPDEPGYKEATLNITSNDPDDPVEHVLLSGQAFARPEPVINVNRTLLDFDSVDVRTDKVLTLLIKNIGQAALTIKKDSLGISGKDAMHFYYENLPADSELQYGDSLQINLGFRPEAEGNKTAFFHITSNDAEHPDTKIELSGTGRRNPLVLPQIRISPEEIHFDEGTYVNTVKTEKLKIFNDGNVDLIVYHDSLDFENNDPAVFSIEDVLTDLVIAKGDSHEIDISFKATDTENRSAALLVYSNDLDSPKLVVLSGKAEEVPVPSIEIPPDTPEFFNYGQDQPVSFQILSVTPVDSAVLNYGKGGERLFNSITLSDSNGKWKATVPGNMIGERGLEYFVDAFYAGRKASFNQQIKRVEIGQIFFPEESQERKYQLFSVPLDMKQQTLADLLVDDLDEYDSTQYRVFDWSQEDSDYVELSDLSYQLTPGKSLWLITGNPKTIDIENSISVSSAANYPVSLQAGWNMISNPFAFPVSVSDIDTSLLLQTYDGNGWQQADTLLPFRGYVINVKNDTVLSIPAIEAAGLPKAPVRFLADADWYFQISGKSGETHDRFNFAGVKAHARNSASQDDYPEPPPIGTFVSVSFIDQNSGGKYSTDFRKPKMQGYSFDIKIESNINSIKTIDFIPNDLPQEFDWTIVSRESKIILGKNSISVRKNQLLRLLVGTDEYLNELTTDYKIIPAKISLKQNYPNPFNPQTTIDFELNKDVNVRIIIFDVLGRQVKSLIDGRELEAGYYSFIWDGFTDQHNKVSSGAYFLYFKAGTYTKTIKMIMNN